MVIYEGLYHRKTRRHSWRLGTVYHQTRGKEVAGALQRLARDANVTDEYAIMRSTREWAFPPTLRSGSITPRTCHAAITFIPARTFALAENEA